MKKLAILCCLPFLADADVVIGPQFTESGIRVETQGLEWLSLDATNNRSLASMISGLESGWTDNQGNQWEAGDWRFATRHETETLLTSLWGGALGLSSSVSWATQNADGAKWFKDNLKMTAYDNAAGTVTNSDLIRMDFGNFFFGIGECGTSINKGYGQACFGSIHYAENILSDKTSYLTDADRNRTAVTYTADSGHAGSFFDTRGIKVTENYSRESGYEFNEMRRLDSTSGDVQTGMLLVRGESANFGLWGEPQFPEGNEPNIPGQFAEDVPLKGAGAMALLGLCFVTRRSKFRKKV